MFSWLFPVSSKTKLPLAKISVSAILLHLHLKILFYFSIFCELRCNAIQSLMHFLDDVFVEGKQSNKVKELLVQENR